MRLTRFSSRSLGPAARRAAHARTMAGLALAAACAVTACGSGSSPGSPAASGGPVPNMATGKLHGTLTLAAAGVGSTVIQPIVRAFEKQNPGVKIQQSTYADPGAPYQSALLTQKLAGNLPDIVFTYDVESPTLSSDGVVRNLSPFLAKGEPYQQNYWLPNIMASYIPTAGKDKGQVFGLPNEADSVVVYYNENEFKAAGVPFPTNNWTWSQMMADAAKLKQFKGGTQTQWGICDRPDWEAMYNPLMKAFGVTSVSETKADLASAGALKAWKMLIAPTQNGEAVPYSTYLSNAGNCDPIFDSGQAAMSVGVRPELPTIRAASAGKFKFDVVPMPFVQGVNGPTRSTGAGSIGWAISSQAKNIPLSLAFLHFLFSPAGQRLEEKSYSVVPAISSALSGGALWQKLPPPPANAAAYTTAAKAGLIAPQTPNTVFTLTLKDIPKTIQSVLSGQSYSQAFGQLNSTINAAYKGGPGTG